MTRLDGTDKFPLKLPDVLAARRSVIRITVKGRQKRIAPRWRPCRRRC